MKNAMRVQMGNSCDELGCIETARGLGKSGFRRPEWTTHRVNEMGLARKNKDSLVWRAVRPKFGTIEMIVERARW